jgi:hypothetical protein
MAIHTLTQRYRSILAAVGNALTAEELANLSTRVLKAMRSKGYCATRSVKKAIPALSRDATKIVRLAGETMAYSAKSLRRTQGESTVLKSSVSCTSPDPVSRWVIFGIRRATIILLRKDAVYASHNVH